MKHLTILTVALFICTACAAQQQASLNVPQNIPIYQNTVPVQPINIGGSTEQYDFGPAGSYGITRENFYYLY